MVIAVVLFAGFELIVRFGFPQTRNTTYIGEKSLGQRDKIVGHINQPNAHALITSPEFDVEYVVNEQGFRDTSLYSPNKPAGVTRVLLLGDSFTFGSGNDYADIWPVLIENQLRDKGHQIEVIKAGVPGYDTHKEVLYMERLYEELQPDIVIFTFLPNDLFTNTPILEASNEPAQKRDDGIRNKGDKKSVLHSVTLIKRMLMSNDTLYERLYLMTGRRAYFSTEPGDEVLKQYEETEKLLSRANRFCKDKNCEFMVLSIPQQFQVLAIARGESPEGIDPTFIDTRLESFAQNEGFEWISLLPGLAKAYNERDEDLYYRFDGHLNKSGNEVAAQIISNALESTLARPGAQSNSSLTTQ
ncbi:MAG: GDSL-type esterase/lipase family protein [Stappiaceae bacterium]